MSQERKTPVNPSVAEAERLLKKGDYRDAADMLRRFTLDKPVADAELPKAFELALQAYQSLGDMPTLDTYRSDVVQRHGKHPRVLSIAARSLKDSWAHHGVILDGEFQRGQWGEGHVNVNEADRTQVLAWLVEAVRLDAGDTSRESLNTLRTLSETLVWMRSGDAVWRLQEKTDLGSVPDYNDPDAHIVPGGQLGWPVDADKAPIAYKVPEFWDDAANDGERYRWVLAEIARREPTSTIEMTIQYASFLRSHLGVGTLGGLGFRSNDDGVADDLLSLRTLSDDETVARFATGIQRVTLPDDLNFVAMIAGLPDSWGRDDQLSQIYLDRQQYTKAEGVLRLRTKLGTSTDSLGDRYRQIVGNLGQLQSVTSQPAGSNVTVKYRFRNGQQVDFTAQPIDVEGLFAYWRDGIERSRPTGADVFGTYDRLGQLFINPSDDLKRAQKFLGDVTAEWTVSLEPPAGHFDKTQTIETPLSDGGAYLVTARMKDGNVSRVVVWIDDLAIVRKPLGDNRTGGRELIYVAHPDTGTPVASATVELFGWKNDDKRPRRILSTAQTAVTNEQGLVEVTLPDHRHWTIAARTGDGRFAILGGQWLGTHRSGYNVFSRQTTPYAVTDRPLYRPGHEVQGHVWLRNARYDMGDVSELAGVSGRLELVDPQGNEVFKQEVTLDEFGGFDFAWTVADDAKLGTYVVQLYADGRYFRCGTFRVEEYRKPDFEVTVDQPDGPVTLGASVDVTVRADYYAGGAVSNGTVNIKVERTAYNETFYPVQPWDWLYDNGYGWRPFMGFRHRGRGWWPGRQSPPELVLQQELTLQADGTATVSIDTQTAKALFGDKSQQYRITAEATDVSRRVVTATGSVVAAAKPFEAQIWSRRGFVEVGDTLPLQITARRIGGGSPVEGNVDARLLKLTTQNGDVVEKEVDRQSLKLRNGSVDVTFSITEAGLYRVRADISEGDATETTTWEFVARGDRIDTAPDEPITITADRREYAVGDVAKVLVTTSKPDTQVLLFERVEGGQYPAYEARQLSGRATLIEIPITAADMPNLFVEAVAVVDGDTHSVVTELFVPPASRALDVTIEADNTDVGPGEKVSLTIKAVDANGRPHAGSVAVSVYDRSLDAIAGGGGPGDIRKTFWAWRRAHYINGSDSLGRVASEVLKRKEIRLQPLGRFGHLSDVMPESEERFAGVGGGVALGMDLQWGLQSRTSTWSYFDSDGAVPSAAPMRARAKSGPELSESAAVGDASGGETASPAVAVRENFADTAFWSGVVTTNHDGLAHVSFTMPENLTAWSAKTWVVAPGTRVGQAETGIVTSKDVLVRVIAPRFLVETDEVVLSGVVQNQTDEDVFVETLLDLDGDVLTHLGKSGRSGVVPAHGTLRFDWPCKAVGEGEAGLTLTARSSAGDDAMRVTLPVQIHGALRTESWAGVLTSEASQTIDIVVPGQRRTADSVLSVRVSPTVAAAILESLPYLIEYPYGCTEQTLNRFLPAVIARRSLGDLGLSLSEIAEQTAKLDPNVPDMPTRVRDDRAAVLSDKKLDDVAAKGLARLLEMQLSDGGWGWFSGFGERSSPHTTVVVVRGLARAKQAGADVPSSALERGWKWLERYRTKQLTFLRNHDNDIKDVRRKASADHLDAMIEMTLAEAGRSDEAMRAYLFRDRLKMSPLSLAMIGLAFSDQPTSDRFRTVVGNLEQFFVGDSENGTAYLETPDRFGYWWWYGDDVEANAYALKLFVKSMPNDPRVAGLARYLLNNRRNATYWKSTRDTAIAVESLCDYLKTSGELDPDVTLEVVIDGVTKREVRVTRENLFAFDGTVMITGEDVTAGPHTVELRRRGRGPLYYAVQSTNFSLENFIPVAGLELKTKRRYWKLTPRDQSTTAAGGRGQVVDIDVEAYDRKPLAQNETVASGTLVEVELLVESKNDYEYLILEDRKPAGFETVDGLSGYRPGFGGAYVEFRDDRVAMFFRRINRGTLATKYRVRAEQPGSFSALPAYIEAMYAPTLVGNSDEQKLAVSEVE